MQGHLLLAALLGLPVGCQVQTGYPGSPHDFRYTQPTRLYRLEKFWRERC